MKITPKILEEAKKLYLEGNSIKETVSRIYDKFKVKISTDVLRRKLHRLGIIRDNSAAQKLAKRKHLPIEKIIELYKNQVSLRKLAKMFHSNKKPFTKF